MDGNGLIWPCRSRIGRKIRMKASHLSVTERAENTIYTSIPVGTEEVCVERTEVNVPQAARPNGDRH